MLTIAATLSLLALAQTTPKDTTSPTSALPVKAVTLFSSGVSFLLREGEVTGAATVPLAFRTSQVNDILKSLVLMDENGQVQPAVYAAKDPVNRTLQAFAVDVTRPPSRADLLGQLRGQSAEIEAGGRPIPGANPPQLTPIRNLTGQIVGVEGPQQFANGGYYSAGNTLLLLTEKGLQSVSIEEINAVKLLDQKLNQELATALSLLATGADDKRRNIVLKFDGKGTRSVRVGYVTEAPLWKVSYRLVLGGAGIGSGSKSSGEAKPYLQGWALVENTTDEDWTNIQLTLVSGRPISFIQDLYQPLYLPRPVVGADLIASPLPQLAEGAMDSAKKDNEINVAAKAALRNSMARGQGGGGGGFGGLGGPGGGVEALADMATAPASAPLNMATSVASQASGEKQGELFSYRIKTPISLPRQQAAMIPVVAQEIDGEKLSLYNADLDPRFPLNGVRIKNNTPLHLKGGPVTLFEDSTYAGDARMLDIPPGDNRILTYAVDLAVAGERQIKGSNVVETSIVVRRGVLTISKKETAETLYTLKNKSDKPRLVLVEHAFSPEYKLIAPEKFNERTPNLYRFAVSVPAGKSETLTVKLERPLTETMGLVDADLGFIEFNISRKSGVSEKLKVALAEVLARRRKVQEFEGQAEARENEIKSIDQDQDRIRKNMNSLDRNSALYKRYVDQLDAQETKIEGLRKSAAELRNKAAAAKLALSAYVDTLDVSS